MRFSTFSVVILALVPAAVVGWPTVLLGPEPESRLMRDEARRGVILPAGPSAIPHEGIINEVEIYVHEDAPTLGAGMRIQVWRSDAEFGTGNLTLQLVGQTQWRSNILNGLRKFRLQPPERLRVRPGDTWGVAFFGSNPVAYDPAGNCADVNQTMTLEESEPELDAYYNFVNTYSCRHYSLRIIMESHDCEHLWASEEDGILMSPNYPGYYENNYSGCWVIKARTGRIQVTADEIDTEFCYDYLQIYDGPTSASPHIATWCGVTESRAESTGSTMRLVFTSDDSVVSFGFALIYIEVDARRCETLVATGDNQEVTSPDFPRAYPANDHRCWIIRADEMGMGIDLSFLDFYLDDTRAGCPGDYLRVVEGDTAAGVELGRFCGRTLPDPLRTRANCLYLEFQSDGRRPGMGQGFQLQYVLAGDDLETDVEDELYEDDLDDFDALELDP